MGLTRKNLLNLAKLLKLKNVSKKTKEELKILIKNYEDNTSIKILQTGKTIRYIYHSADIHIRVIDRHQEYEEVFNNLYKILSNVDRSESVFVISGDIFHNRDKLVSESIILFNNFIEKLSSILDVILIIGNHDTFIHSDRLDMLSGITNIKNFENFHFLKKSGIYKYNNIDFYVSSLIDNKFMSFYQKTNEIHVSLFHGIVSGSKMENGITVSTNEDINISDFKGFDYVLLGDIHKMQYLTDTIAYPGSLIQQNHKEDIDHGILKWDIQEKTSIFIKVPNRYGFVTLDIQKDNIVPENIVFPEFTRLKLRHNYDETPNLDIIKNEISKKTKIISLTTEILEEKNNIKHTKPENDDSNALEIFKRTINRFSDEKIQNDLLNLYSEYVNKHSNIENNMDALPWQIKFLEFKNMFVYGGDKLNKVIFDDKGVIIGVIGDNASGKTSLMNIILYGIFGCIFKTKNFSNRNVINRKSKNFYLKMVIQLDGDPELLVIEKEGRLKKRKGGLAVGMEEFIILKKGNINLTGSSKLDTVTNIYKILGLTNKENFILTNVVSYTNYISLLNMQSSDISKTLGELFDLQIYKAIYTDVVKKHKEIIDSIKSKKTAISFLENKVIKYKNSITDNYDKETIINMIEDNEKKLETLIENDYENLPLDKDNLEINQKILDNEEVYIEIINKYSNILPEVTMSQLLEFTVNCKVKESCDQSQYFDWSDEEINELMIMIHKKEAIIENCKYSEADYLKAKEKINNQNFENMLLFLNEAKLRKKSDKGLYIPYKILDNIFIYVDNINYVATIKEYETCINTKEELKLLSEKLNIILSYKKRDYNNAIKAKKAEICLNKINSYKKNKKILELREEIKSKKKETYDNITKLNKELFFIKFNEEEVYKIEDSIKNIKNELSPLEEIEKTYRYFKDIMNDKCFPKMLLLTKIKKIEMECNILCYKLIGMKISLDTYCDEECKYEITASKNNSNSVIGIDQISGFERFVVNVGLKMALDKYRSGSSGKIFFIDEAFDCVSSENIDKVDELFSYLKEYYSTILVISHNDNLKKKVDKQIIINVSDHFSFIN
jgi:DNA repair exonuclease SbcCD ATPase subunit